MANSFIVSLEITVIRDFHNDVSEKNNSLNCHSNEPRTKESRSYKMYKMYKISNFRNK